MTNDDLFPTSRIFTVTLDKFIEQIYLHERVEGGVGGIIQEARGKGLLALSGVQSISEYEPCVGASMAFREAIAQIAPNALCVVDYKPVISAAGTSRQHADPTAFVIETGIALSYGDNGGTQ